MNSALLLNSNFRGAYGIDKDIKINFARDLKQLNFKVFHLFKKRHLPNLSDFIGSELGEVFIKAIGMTRYFMVAA